MSASRDRISVGIRLCKRRQMVRTVRKSQTLEAGGVRATLVLRKVGLREMGLLGVQFRTTFFEPKAADGKSLALWEEPSVRGWWKFCLRADLRRISVLPTNIKAGEECKSEPSYICSFVSRTLRSSSALHTPPQASHPSFRSGDIRRDLHGRP